MSILFDVTVCLELSKHVLSNDPRLFYMLTFFDKLELDDSLQCQWAICLLFLCFWGIEFVFVSMTAHGYVLSNDR